MIFEDASRVRWRVVVSILLALTVMTLVSFALDFVDDLKYPVIPSEQALEAQAAPAAPAAPAEDGAKGLPAYSDKTMVRSAFLMQLDDYSVTSLDEHLSDLDVVFPDWFTFTGEKPEITRSIDPDLLQLLRESRAQVIPTIANLAPGRWTGAAFAKYIATAANRATLSNLILQALTETGVYGIDVDFEQMTASSMPNYISLLRELTSLLHAHTKSVMVDLPIDDDTYDYRLIGSIVDKVVVMAYDEHYETSSPGPIASYDWFEKNVATALSQLPPQKTIVALGQYAYDWNTTRGTGQPADYSSAIETARANRVTIKTDDASINSTFSYRASNGDQHEVWMLDAVSMWNQLQFLKQRHVYGVSLWRTGSEDPSIWDFYSAESQGNVPVSVVERARALESSTYSGDGEFLRVTGSPGDGARQLAVRGGLIYRAVYTSYPTGYRVERFGHSDTREVALTFDDGPDPTYTPKILDILKKYNVKATFFVVGEQAKSWFGVARRIAAEGHTIGNHTYYHTNDTLVVDSRFKQELDSTQRVIRAFSQKATTLFRSPYIVDSEPRTSDELHPLDVASHMGYTVVNADIDSEDFSSPGVSHIVSNVLDGLSTTGSNVVLFHDGGGDRSQTVEALEQLIPKLRDQGYTFVTPNQLLNVTPDQIMPALSLGDKILSINDGFRVQTSLWIHDWVWGLVGALFLATIVLGIGRLSLLTALVFRPRAKGTRPAPIFRPFVSVLIPALNEDQVIAKTLDALLRSDYLDFEVVVIDDGSRDRTREVVERYSARFPNVRVISKPNGGKFSALNLGLEQAKSDYVVTIDADTQVFPNTLADLVAPFADPAVDAVCGNVKVGNAKNLLTSFQRVEYVTTQNFDRRAFDSMNCICVVPGATGAWRKSSVLRVGGYSGETLTEDADLTLTLLESGGKVVYAPKATSCTEAPETARDLFTQRFRWSFGIYQCLWKHRKSIFKGSLGWLGLPNMLIFQLAWPLLSPIGDAVFIYALVTGNFSAIAFGYFVFLAMDLVASVVAYALDGHSFWDMWPVPIQRFYYRQFMYAVTFKAVFAALRGGRHTWNKLRRRNSVGASPAPIGVEAAAEAVFVSSPGL